LSFSGETLVDLFTNKIKALIKRWFSFVIYM